MMLSGGRTAWTLLGVLLALAVIIQPLAASEVVPIDDNHQLATEDAVQTYQEEGVATANLTTPDMSLTIAKDHSDVGLDGFHVDSSKHYLRIQYREDIARTIRFYIPQGYWHPYQQEAVSAMNGQVAVDLSPTADGEYTAVTVHLYKPTDVVFPISKTDAFVFDRMETYRGWVNNTTGWSPPRMSSGQWSFVDESRLTGTNATTSIQSPNGSLTVQYDANSASDTQSWISVPKCDGSDQPVCKFQKDGVDNRTYLLSTASDPPAIRFKHEKDSTSELKSAIRDIKQIPTRIMNDIGNLFGGS